MDVYLSLGLKIKSSLYSVLLEVLGCLKKLTMNNEQVQDLRLFPSSGPVDWEPVPSLTPDEANGTVLQNILFAGFKV